jgi:hypothetical protein
MAEPDPQYEYQKALHAAYQAQRVEADKVALEIGGRYEKLLTLVTGGALVVSLTFIEKIAPTPVPESRWIALISWACLGLSVIACLIAISQSQNAQQKKIENLDSEILQRLYPEDPRYKDLDVSGNPYVKNVRFANIISRWSAIVGLSCLIAFAFLNFPTDKKDESKKLPTNTQQACCPAASTDSAPDKLIRSNEEPDRTTAAKEGEVNMPPKPQPTTPASPPAPPPKPMSETKGSYVPTQNQVTPPPPPPKAPSQGSGS